MKQVLGGFMYENNMEPFWVHKYCACSGKTVGQNALKQWYNVAKVALKCKERR